jgi:NAD(P)-dependent dehydrogenase (short-subunit alcohol dehydrogenase family)
MELLGPKTGVIVAGGAAGIGHATCLALAEHGRPVAVWDVQAEAAHETAAMCRDRFGVKGDVQLVDLADQAAVEKAVPASVGALGGVGALAYCAGVNGWRAGPSRVATDEWDHVMNVNLRGPATLIRLLVPALKAANPGSAIVVLSSASILDTSTWRDPTYLSSKMGLLGLARGMARGLAGDGIRVNVICPGTTDSALFREGLAQSGSTVEDVENLIPLGRLGDPMDIARAIRFLLSDEAAFITGTNLVVDGGRTCGGWTQ